MDKLSEVRTQAEKILQDRQLDEDTYAQEDIRHLVHELQVHQIELELQNEELRKIQQDIETSRNQYADLYDFAPVGYVTLDPEGIIVNVNLTAAALLDSERTRLIGQPLSHFVDRDAQDAYYLYVKKLMNTQIAQICETQLLKKNGAPVYVQLESIAVQDAAGKITGIRAAMSDITERKKAEGELRQLKKAVETMPIGLTITDLDGNILYLNPAEAALHGYQVNEMLGNDLGMFAPVEHRQPLTREQIREMRPSVRESVNIRQNGSLFPVRLLSDVVKTPGGEPVAVVTICEDITVHKYAEDALREAKCAAEAANLAKSTFLANMSHELRTPLSGILGYAQLLKWDTSLTTKQYDEIALIERSGQHLLQLINDILDLAKIEAGKVALTPANVNIRALLADLNFLLRPKTKAKGLTLQMEPAAALPQTIRADEQRLRQVLLNVLGNAIKFTETGGVTLRVTQIPVQRTCPELVEGGDAALLTKLCFEVSDTGIGIAPEDLTRLFEPFEQVGDDTYNAQGTGLGLAISRKLIRIMGGELQVTSALGQGSTFRFELTVPVIAAVDARMSQTRQIVGIQGAAPKILVVEDDPVNRQMLVDMLTTLGCDLRQAANGQSGWQLCQTFQPQAIMIDLRMPEMDGLTLIRQIRRTPALDQVVIVAMSASAYAEDRQHSLTAGSQVFLSKPINMDALLEVLQQFLHLTWRFQEVVDHVENVHPSADELIRPSAAVIHTLRRSAESGDIVELRTQLTALHDEDLRFAPFVSTIQQLARNFQLEAICNFIADCLIEEESPPEALTPEALATLPTEVLHRLAIVADRDALNRLLEEIRRLHPHLADGLAALTQNVASDKISELIRNRTDPKEEDA